MARKLIFQIGRELRKFDNTVDQRLHKVGASPDKLQETNSACSGDRHAPDNNFCAQFRTLSNRWRKCVDVLNRGVHRPYCNCRVADHPWPIALKARKLSKQAAPYPTTGSRVYIANCDFPTGLDLAGWTADQHILNLVAIPSASPPNKANVWLLSTIRRCGRNWIAPRGICDVRKLQDLVLPRMDFAHSNLAWLFLTFDGGHRCAGGSPALELVMLPFLS